MGFGISASRGFRKVIICTVDPVEVLTIWITARASAISKRGCYALKSTSPQRGNETGWEETTTPSNIENTGGDVLRHVASFMPVRERNNFNESSALVQEVVGIVATYPLALCMCRQYQKSLFAQSVKEGLQSLWGGGSICTSLLAV